MVVGPLTGTEIDFPNTPADLEEFHAPNRFVYEWKDDNRWRNIHRPLILPDYIWPPLDIPADPNVDPTGVLPGETGDDGYPGDWKLQALIFPVPSLEANVRVDLLMRSENGGDDPYGTFNHALWDDDFNNAAANENEYHVNNDQKFIIYDNISIIVKSNSYT